MTDYKKDKLQEFLGTSTKYTTHYLSLVSGDGIEIFEFNIGLDTDTVHKLAEFLTRELLDVVVAEEDAGIPVILQAGHYLKCKNLKNDNHTILREHNGNIVYIANVDNIVCSNENTPANSATLHKLFREATAIEANEAILLILSEATTMYHTVSTIQNSLADYKRKLVNCKYSYTKLKKKLKKTKKALAHYSMKCLNKE